MVFSTHKMMKLIKITDKSTRVVPHDRFKSREKGLQKLVEKAMSELLDLNFVGTEMTISYGGRIDSIGMTDENRLTLVEYKERVSKDIFSQGLFYVDCAINSPDEFAKWVRDQSGAEINKQLDPKLILVSKSFNTFQKFAFNRVNNEQELLFKEYEVLKGRGQRYLALRNCPLPQDFTDGQEFDEDLRLIKDNGKVERLQEIINEIDHEEIRTLIFKHAPLLINSRCFKREIKEGYKGINSIFNTALDLSTDRFMILEYDSIHNFLDDAIIKKTWAINHKERMEEAIGEKGVINWNYEPRILIFANKLTPLEKIAIDSIPSQIIPFEYKMFSEKDGSRYLLLEQATLPRDFHTFPKYRIYGIDDTIKNIDNPQTKKALGEIVSEINGLGNDVKIKYRKSSISIHRKNLFCRIKPYREHINIKIKIGSQLQDPTHQTENHKMDENYRRFNIIRKADVPYALQLVKQAYDINK